MEIMQFHLFNSAQHLLIWGFPWLKTHNPHIDWLSGQIKGWGGNCEQTCKFGYFPHHAVTKAPQTVAVPDRSSDYPDLSKVTSCYDDIKEVFNKTKALSLPPNRPFDCAIDLLPGAHIPRGAMDDCISSSLKAGIIRPSSSPAGAIRSYRDVNLRR